MDRTRPPPMRFGDDTPVKRHDPKRETSKLVKRTLRIAKRLRVKHWKRYAPIWQRIDGDWKPYRCPRKRCKSAMFMVIDQEDPFVNVKCVNGHGGKVLKGFAMSKPDG